MSPIGIGTWAMGGTVATWGQVDDNESIAAIHQALDLGINLIDTAPIYGLGHSEEVVGKAIRGRRDEVVLATKCGLQLPKQSGDEPARCLTGPAIIEECENSLRRLRIEAIDLYQVHWPDPNTPMRETMEALLTLQKQGKIREIGLSNFSCEQIASAQEFAAIASVQPPFSMLHLRAADELIPFCRTRDIGVLPYSPLSKGLLTGKFGPDDSFEDIRARDPEFVGNRFHRNLRIVDELKAIADGLGRTTTQLVLNWTLNFPGVTAPLVGAKRPTQVQEHVGAIGWEIPPETLRRIDDLIGGPRRDG